MMDYTIITATEAMLPQIAALEAQCFSSPLTEDLLGRLLQNPRQTLLAAVDAQGALLGYAGMMTVLDEGDIQNIAVRSDARRSGIGAALVEALLRLGQAQNLLFLTLEVRESNTPARALYEKYGFETVGARKNYYEKPTETAILMTKYFRSDANCM